MIILKSKMTWNVPCMKSNKQSEETCNGSVETGKRLAMKWMDHGRTIEKRIMKERVSRKSERTKWTKQTNRKFGTGNKKRFTWGDEFGTCKSHKKKMRQFVKKWYASDERKRNEGKMEKIRDFQKLYECWWVKKRRGAEKTKEEEEEEAMNLIWHHYISME